MKKFDLYVGCSVDGKEKYNREHVRHVILQALENACFDGCTFTDAIGMWEGISELTVVCTICTNDRPDVLDVVETIKECLKQESVMLIESEPRIEFV
jgi:hypothetical protein